MKHYIDKDALEAEIENLLDKGKYHEEYDCAYRDGNNSALYTLKGKLNTLEVKEIGVDSVDSKEDKSAKYIIDTKTLEVKEVNLDKEATHYLLCEHRSPLNDIMHKADLKSEMQYHKDIENAFKAGFGLGIAVSNKAQKGE